MGRDQQRDQGQSWGRFDVTYGPSLQQSLATWWHAGESEPAQRARSGDRSDLVLDLRVHSTLRSGKASHDLAPGVVVNVENSP